MLWAYLEGNDREDDENHHQGDGELKEGLFYAALGAVDRIGLAENAPQATALNLEQGDCSQRHRDDYLCDI